MMTTLLLALALQDTSGESRQVSEDVRALLEVESQRVRTFEELAALGEQLRAASGEERRRLEREWSHVDRRFAAERQEWQFKARRLAATVDARLREKPDDQALLEARLFLAEFSPIRADWSKAASGDDLTHKAALLRHMGRFREARDLLSEALKRSPSDGRAKAYAGLIAFDLFEDAVARETLREAAKAEASLRPGLAVRVLIALQELDLRAQEERKNDLPRVELETPKGKIVLELFEDQAPNTVANFISLVGDGFYDGTQFHRVESNFVIQGGDPLSKNDDPTDDGLGGPGYRFPDELPAGYRRHFRGSLSMANSGPGTNGSQFFITHRVTEPLDGRHTVFGRVLEGMPVVDAIAVGDRITHAHVVRKRPHEYAVQGIIREPSADQHDH